ncbi:MAG: GNAT family N-acetyltransferase [Chloroflexi bacterium]|nr:GNAT family N-acetyltransferase [Chloroflexota bacterium]
MEPRSQCRRRSAGGYYHGNTRETLTPPNVITRPCTIEDIPALLQLWIDSDAVAGPTDDADAINIRLQRDNELFVVAVDGERIVGSLMGGWRGSMARLAVHPDYRRRGNAKRMVAEVEARLKYLGCIRTSSLMFIHEPGAPELWAVAGYEPESGICPYYKDLQLDDPRSWLIYRRGIGSPSNSTSVTVGVKPLSAARSNASAT